MTSNRLLVALVVVTAVLPAMAVAEPTTRGAQLYIEQPHYVGGEVAKVSQDGEPLYKVKGEELRIQPRNFGSGEVVAFGVSTQGGELAYDDRFDEYVFRPETTGTYTLYWVVETTVLVNQSTANGTEQVTTTRQYRYVAHLRVTGATDLVHEPASDRSARKAAAEKWREFNATVQDLRDRGMFVSLGLQAPPSAAEVRQAMVDAYIFTRDPLGGVTSGFGQFHILLITVPGAALAAIIYGGYHSIIVAWFYRRLNIHTRNEQAEGALTERLQALDEQERVRVFNNLTHGDVFADERVAQGWQALGETPRKAFLNWRGKLRERNVVANRLQAMGLVDDGWVGVVDRAATDGGADAEPAIADARLVRQSEVPADADTVDLTAVGPDHPLLDAIDWAADPIRQFDYANADFDRGAIATPVEPADSLADLLETLELDRRHFEDDTAAAEYLLELLQDIRTHGFTDETGRPDTLRHFLNEYLDAMQVLRDRYDVPVDYDADLIERAIREHDARERARETLAGGDVGA